MAAETVDLLLIGGPMAGDRLKISRDLVKVKNYNGISLPNTSGKGYSIYTIGKKILEDLYNARYVDKPRKEKV